eukprot:365128-Chlamydomonas_euryale.AAC.1
MLSGQRNNWVQQQAVRAGHPARNQRRQGTPGIAGAAPAGRQYSNHAATSNRRPQSLPARRLRGQPVTHCTWVERCGERIAVVQRGLLARRLRGQPVTHCTWVERC